MTRFWKTPDYFYGWNSHEGYNNGGIFYPYSILQFILDENIAVEDMDKMWYFEADFDEPVGYGRYSFIPLVTFGIVLNHDTMLLDSWGEIMMAYRVEEAFPTSEEAGTEYSQADADEIFYGTWIYDRVVSEHFWLRGTKGYEILEEDITNVAGNVREHPLLKEYLREEIEFDEDFCERFGSRPSIMEYFFMT